MEHAALHTFMTYVRAWLLMLLLFPEAGREELLYLLLVLIKIKGSR